MWVRVKLAAATAEAQRHGDTETGGQGPDTELKPVAQRQLSETRAASDTVTVTPHLHSPVHHYSSV